VISEVSARQIRDESIARAKLHGVELPHGVPPIISTFGELDLKPANVRVTRAIAVYAVLCVAFEPKRKQASAKAVVLEWLGRFNLLNALTREEFSFLQGGAGIDASGYGGYVETLYAIGWTLNLVQELSPAKDVDENFGSIFPNILVGTNPDYLYREARSRPQNEIVGELDFYYCLHWLSVETKLRRVAWPLPITQDVVRHRRFGLEWALSSDSWELISLDT
jgi:hypothetical protein